LTRLKQKSYHRRLFIVVNKEVCLEISCVLETALQMSQRATDRSVLEVMQGLTLQGAMFTAITSQAARKK
jgi:hypothetical protein